MRTAPVIHALVVQDQLLHARAIRVHVIHVLAGQGQLQTVHVKTAPAIPALVLKNHLMHVALMAHALNQRGHKVPPFFVL